MMRRLELLAPAKDFATACDAIDCGADAIYIGASCFGARYAATNSVEDIVRVVEYAHRFGVRVYVTMNTLLFDSEIEDARRLAEALVKAGVDALIVQDMAYCQMRLPIALHASTQTNCATTERVRFFAETGFSRVVVERSLSLADIARIHEAVPDVEIEAFVHGAICVSQSGRCFLSRSMSSRSGNRGECSQPCRLTYDLVDDRGKKIVDGKHLLSIRDLDLSARLGEMIDCGVTSFKIEGRLKDRLYVRNIVSLYRRSLDKEIARRKEYCRASVGESVVEFNPDSAKSFTRSACEYFFDGKRRGVASFDTPKATGERIGRIAQTCRDGFVLDRDHDLSAGDGICYVCDGELLGTTVNAVEGRCVKTNTAVEAAVGTEILRNRNLRFEREVERARVRRAISVDVCVKIGEGGLILSATDESGCRATVSESVALDEAKSVEKMEATLRTTLSKTGDTYFDVRNITIEGKVRFVPVSMVASLRRRLLEELDAERKRQYLFPKPFVENRNSLYEKESLSEQDNVTNSLARTFYSDHGVKRIDEGLDMLSSTAGSVVMTSDYCIRREIGQCLSEHSSLSGDLFLVRGRQRYRLQFDCKACQMKLIDVK